jgi:hypothetical protein
VAALAVPPAVVAVRPFGGSMSARGPAFIFEPIAEEARVEKCSACDGYGISHPRILYRATVTVDVCRTCGGSGEIRMVPMRYVRTER